MVQDTQPAVDRQVPTPVVVWSKTCTVFYCLNTGFVCSNTTLDLDVNVCLGLSVQIEES
jgi:hypothetical protein